MVTTTGDVGEGGGGLKNSQQNMPKTSKPPRKNTPKPKKVK